MNMKKLLLSLFSTSLLTQAAVAVDLTGVWQAGSTFELSFTQTGQNIDGTCIYSSSIISQYGFTNGGQCIRGSLNGTVFSGTFLSNYPIEYKSSCPAQWSKWIDITLSLSPDGNTLSGSLKKKILNLPSCIETDDFGSVTFTRKTPIVSTTSTNNCTATFNMNTGRLVIPCLAVSMSAPFGGAEQIFNYGVEMQQRSGAFVFDLDLSKVVQR